MKIGLSYSRCILDIVEERVDIEDVLVLVTRTDFDPTIDDEWADIWQGYCHGGMSRAEWGSYDYNSKEDEDKFRSVSIMLWEDGKLHQPRKFGTHPRRLPYHWLETVVPDKDLENSPAVKDAWDKFQIVSGLASTKLKVHNE
jgi:hypothetical protein